MTARFLTALGAIALSVGAQAVDAQRAPAGTLMVSNMSENTVTILNAGTGRVWATLPTGEGPHEVAVRVFTTADRREKFKITVLGDSLLSTAEVPGSPSPEGVALARDSRWAFVTLQGKPQVITIDLERGVIRRYAPTGVWSDGIGYSPLVRGR